MFTSPGGEVTAVKLPGEVSRHNENGMHFFIHPSHKEKTMSIEINSSPTPEQIEKLGVKTWPIWTKDISEFPWTYTEPETCLFLEGDVTVTPDGGTPVNVKKGDLVTFPSGMSCTWKVNVPVKKHYRLG